MNRQCCYILLLLLVACLLATCRTATESYRVVTFKSDRRSVAERLESVTDGYSCWQTFSAKGKFSISGGSEEMSASMQMRMAAGKYVCISLRGGMGIEGGRIFITSDSMYIVDKINKCYLADKISTFTGGVKLSLADFQNLLLCRMFGTSVGVGQVDGNGSFSVATMIDGGSECNFSFDGSNMLRSIEMLSGDSANACRIGYDGYIETRQAGAVLATSVSIDSQLPEGGNVSMYAEYSPSSIVWDKPFSDTFAINANYRRIDARLLLQQLGNEL